MYNKHCTCIICNQKDESYIMSLQVGNFQWIYVANWPISQKRQTFWPCFSNWYHAKCANTAQGRDNNAWVVEKRRESLAVCWLEKIPLKKGRLEPSTRTQKPLLHNIQSVSMIRFIKKNPSHKRCLFLHKIMMQIPEYLHYDLNPPGLGEQQHHHLNCLLLRSAFKK